VGKAFVARPVPILPIPKDDNDVCFSLRLDEASYFAKAGFRKPEENISIEGRRRPDN
jgi:hypothetical protein